MTRPYAARRAERCDGCHRKDDDKWTEAKMKSRSGCRQDPRWSHNSAMALHIALPNDLFSKLGVPKLTG
jgi:hypothetical protein